MPTNLHRLPLMLLVGCAWAKAPEVTADDCASCHVAQAEAFAASRHAHAGDNANFAAAVAVARNPRWCRSCHGEQGLSCTDCHADHDEGPVDCGRCHEFEGPNEDATAFGGDLLQGTMSEWKASGTTRTCADCHLDGHRFPGGHDAGLVRSALRIQAEADQLIVSTTEALGHALPTGDPFRRLIIELCVTDACDQPERHGLWVRHALDGDGWMRVVDDSRLGPPGSPRDRVVLPRGDARWWRIQLHLADPALELPRAERIIDVEAGGFP